MSGSITLILEIGQFSIKQEEKEPLLFVSSDTFPYTYRVIEKPRRLFESGSIRYARVIICTHSGLDTVDLFGRSLHLFLVLSPHSV
ncbi:hypothetical protein C4556_00835 [Candidatus Parcubacteria bacterium]|nr:MAG: hypothetical protein C4556_00835 [Candidatus Parcubacteria bacterium]